MKETQDDIHEEPGLEPELPAPMTHERYDDELEYEDEEGRHRGYYRWKSREDPYWYN